MSSSKRRRSEAGSKPSVIIKGELTDYEVGTSTPRDQALPRTPSGNSETLKYTLPSTPSTVKRDDVEQHHPFHDIMKELKPKKMLKQLLQDHMVADLNDDQVAACASLSLYRVVAAAQTHPGGHREAQRRPVVAALWQAPLEIGQQVRGLGLRVDEHEYADDQPATEQGDLPYSSPDSTEAAQAFVEHTDSGSSLRASDITFFAATASTAAAAAAAAAAAGGSAAVQHPTSAATPSPAPAGPAAAVPDAGAAVQLLPSATPIAATAGSSEQPAGQIQQTTPSEQPAAQIQQTNKFSEAPVLTIEVKTPDAFLAPCDKCLSQTLEYAVPKVVQRVVNRNIKKAGYIALGCSMRDFFVVYVKPMATARVGAGGHISWGPLPQHPERIDQLTTAQKEAYASRIQIQQAEGVQYTGTFLVAQVFRTNSVSLIKLNNVHNVEDECSIDKLPTSAWLFFRILFSRIIGRKRVMMMRPDQIYKHFMDYQAACLLKATQWIYCAEDVDDDKDPSTAVPAFAREWAARLQGQQGLAGLQLQGA